VADTHLTTATAIRECIGPPMLTTVGRVIMAVGTEVGVTAGNNTVPWLVDKHGP